MVNARLLVAGALMLVVLSACATLEFGREFDPQDFHKWVKRGKTTQSEVKERLGQPASSGLVVESNGDQLDRWIYYHGKGKMNNMAEAKFRILEVRFDAEGKVASYNWSSDQ